MPIAQEYDFFFQWHLTERCNLNCRHCYQTRHIAGEMSLDEIKEGIGEMADMLNDWADRYGIIFSPGFNVTGGEPFLRKDLAEILEEIGRRNFDIYVLSNGTLIHREHAKMLSDLGVKGVQVSIEGPEFVHDALRGTGSFSSALKGIWRLLDADVQVTLNVTLSEANAAFLFDMVQLASLLGVHGLGLSRLVPSGRGMAMLNHMLEKERVKELYHEIFSMKPEGFKIMSGDPVVSQMLSNPEEKPAPEVATAGCAAGVSGLALLPDGTILPCRRLPVPLGNIREDSLREVWATSAVLESLRDKSSYKGKCGRCRRWSGCRGCRAIAYAYSQARGEGDFLAEDPQCFLDN